MIPREKAAEILTHFQSCYWEFGIWINSSTYDKFDCAIPLPVCKKLSIFHVEGILCAINESMLYKQEKRNFWENVKQELINLPE